MGPHTLLGETSNGIAALEKLCQFLQKLNTELRYDPGIPLLGIYSRELIAYVHTKACMQIFIALFIITNKWRHAKCS